MVLGNRAKTRQLVYDALSNKYWWSNSCVENLNTFKIMPALWFLQLFLIGKKNYLNFQILISNLFNIYSVWIIYISCIRPLQITLLLEPFHFFQVRHKITTTPLSGSPLWTSTQTPTSGPSASPPTPARTTLAGTPSRQAGATSRVSLHLLGIYW